MSDTAEDRYSTMSGPELAGELAERELPISGKVAELRERLRADDAALHAERLAGELSDQPEGEETPEEPSEVPEPREPVDYVPMAVELTEDQARQLTAGESRLRQFTKHVTQMTPRTYCEGDRVTGIVDWAAHTCLVLPFGIEITLSNEAPEEDGLERLREADEKLKD